ncbi:XRE family transcriptional regulator [Cupriavidus sp. UME77]|uniref:XRE family transcriptional regulator n=1 Tax=Cupriavidus sp. UME77 TaxID=1862321 RepID=UPI001601F683|nr:XRE family transcriptional regulator [Cupriavidus sp. UME77]MBB1636074.1 hypothetical protein [Cupriavidus sp. UME77]
MMTAHVHATSPQKHRGRRPLPSKGAGLEFAHDTAHGEEMLIAEPSRRRAGPSNAQREQHVKQALTRFVRKKTLPEELEALRYNLIVARVMSGMTAVEAAERFGYANSTQLSLIEAGERKTPKDWKFLAQASRVYAVSTDFLLGLSPHMDFDAKVSRQHALLRKTEAVIGAVSEAFATALIHFSEQEHLGREELDRIGGSALRLEDAMDRLRERGFDDFPGGAPLLAAVGCVVQAAEPARRKAKQFQSIDHYLGEMRAGRMPVIPYLAERYSQETVRSELLGETVDSENA